MTRWPLTATQSLEWQISLLHFLFIHCHSKFQIQTIFPSLQQESYHNFAYFRAHVWDRFRREFLLYMILLWIAHLSLIFILFHFLVSGGAFVSPYRMSVALNQNKQIQKHLTFTADVCISCVWVWRWKVTADSTTQKKMEYHRTERMALVGISPSF